MNASFHGNEAGTINFKIKYKGKNQIMSEHLILQDISQLQHFLALKYFHFKAINAENTTSCTDVAQSSGSVSRAGSETVGKSLLLSSPNSLNEDL